MNFNKPSISKNVGKFLLENVKTEKEKESFFFNVSLSGIPLFLPLYFDSIQFQLITRYN